MATRIPAWAQDKPSESKIESLLVREMTRIGGKAWKWKSPGNKGVPDRILMHPNFRGRCLFVELKAPGKKLRGNQPQVLADLEAIGHTVFVIDSEGLVRKLIADLCRFYGIEEGGK